jgi:hypothetical protein
VSSSQRRARASVGTSARDRVAGGHVQCKPARCQRLLQAGVAVAMAVLARPAAACAVLSPRWRSLHEPARADGDDEWAQRLRFRPAARMSGRASAVQCERCRTRRGRDDAGREYWRRARRVRRAPAVRDEPDHPSVQLPTLPKPSRARSHGMHFRPGACTTQAMQFVQCSAVRRHDRRRLCRSHPPSPQ